MSRRRKQTARGEKSGVVVSRRLTPGSLSLPPFVELGHKHLEKEAAVPAGIKPGAQVTLRVPLDLLRMVLPAAQVDLIDEVELTYVRQ